MALSVHKAPSNLSKLESLYETNYICWSQKLLIIFEQLEVDYMLFSYVIGENKPSEITIASGDRIDKSKTVDEETRKKVRER